MDLTYFSPPSQVSSARTGRAWAGGGTFTAIGATPPACTRRMTSLPTTARRKVIQVRSGIWILEIETNNAVPEIGS